MNIEQGKKFDSILKYLNNKLLEPSRLGDGKSSPEAFDHMNRRISTLDNNISDSLRFWEERKENDYSDSAKMLIDDLTSELDKIEAYGSNHGYICYNSNASSPQDNCENSTDFVSPDLQNSILKDQSIINHKVASKRFIGKKLLFDGAD
ncbi:uncharacterized protein LOC106661433 [Cimex lectularius]|uniref:Uncharacterized protein n=1 Tax=Cimex lectularius TaxID=79782 RepID=A0A8I6R7J5_CIMLE|nr:uncharacterized protein LOC106661433 [Cimex lectularius]